MMLQKRLSRKVKGVKYVKWVVTIPPKMIKSLNWKERIPLSAVVESDKLIIEPKIKTNKTTKEDKS